MTLVPIVEQKLVAAMVTKLRRRLCGGMPSMTRTIGFPGGNAFRPVFWNPAEKFWTHIGLEAKSNRYWCCYGTQDPSENRSLDITVEINPPRQGYDRKIAGALVEDRLGATFLAHSGKVGGGKTGVGKSAFLDYCPGLRMANVQWPDGQQTQVVIIAALDDEHLPQQVAAFVSAVGRFKAQLGTIPTAHKSATLRRGFNPEFEGKRRPFRVNSSVTGYCDHGVVVRVLKEQMLQVGIELNNDRYRDLYQLNQQSQARILIEVKTSADLSDVYSGVGQLVVNGALQDAKLHRVLVLPEGLPTHQIAVLEGIGITVLPYTWEQGVPKFRKLKSVAESLS